MKWSVNAADFQNLNTPLGQWLSRGIFLPVVFVTFLDVEDWSRLSSRKRLNAALSEIRFQRRIPEVIMTNIQRAQTLNQGQFSRLIKITTATSRYFQRDVLVLMLGHHCGMRVTEISRITVADVLQPSGKLRVEVSLRADVTKGCSQRCAYLATKPLIAALEVYLAYRVERGVGTDLYGKTHRGLLPNQPLIYSSRGAGLSQNSKRRVLDSGVEKIYKCCDSLQAHITNLYKKGGTQGSSHSGRRTFASKILSSTGDMDTVATLLGHASIACSQRYVDIDPMVLRDMFANSV